MCKLVKTTEHAYYATQVTCLVLGEDNHGYSLQSIFGYCFVNRCWWLAVWAGKRVWGVSNLHSMDIHKVSFKILHTLLLMKESQYKSQNVTENELNLCLCVYVRGYAEALQSDLRLCSSWWGRGFVCRRRRDRGRAADRWGMDVWSCGAHGQAGHASRQLRRGYMNDQG